MTKPRPLHLVAVVAAVAAVALTAAVARPAQALPSYKSTCSTCHSGTPSGTVTGTPSKTTLAPGEAYSVNVAVALGASGNSGYWISSNDATTPAVSLTGGPGSSPYAANLTAPAAAGTYTYKVWGAKGKPSAGQALSSTFQITVVDNSSGGGGGGTVDTDRADHGGAERRQGDQGQEGDPEVPGQRRSLPTWAPRPPSSRSRTRPGKVVKTHQARRARRSTCCRRRPSGCRLAKGTYKFSVTATDAAGNVTVKAAVNKLTVK